jgi:hypothetical protein
LNVREKISVNPEVILGYRYEAQIARHVDIGLGRVESQQLGSLVHARGGGVHARRLTPDLVDRGETIEK